MTIPPFKLFYTLQILFASGPVFGGKVSGNAKSDLGDNEGAIRNYDKAIELNPKDAKAYVNRGLAKINLGDNEGAIRDSDKAIELNPQYAEAYVNRGFAKVLSGDKSGALLDLDIAKKLGFPKADEVIQMIKQGRL